MVIQGNKQKQAPRISGRKKLMPKGKLLFLSELFLTQLSLKNVFFKIPNKFYILKKIKSYQIISKFLDDSARDICSLLLTILEFFKNRLFYSIMTNH